MDSDLFNPLLPLSLKLQITNPAYNMDRGPFLVLHKAMDIVDHDSVA